LFNLERELSPGRTPQIVDQQSQERSLEQRQRDVYETHRHRTFAVAYYMTGNEIEAEEVLTDTFVRAFDQAAKENQELDGKGVDTAMVDELRQRMPLDEIAEPLSAAASPGLAGRNVRRTDLEEALQELPPNERIVFLLRDVEGYDADRVAELIEIPRPQVERTLLAARIRMRNVLARPATSAAAAA
jgi:RNA polymerase sigma-70 factor (ECF subfamily)